MINNARISIACGRRGPMHDVRPVALMRELVALRAISPSIHISHSVKFWRSNTHGIEAVDPADHDVVRFTPALAVRSPRTAYVQLALATLIKTAGGWISMTTGVLAPEMDLLSRTIASRTYRRARLCRVPVTVNTQYMRWLVGRHARVVPMV